MATSRTAPNYSNQPVDRPRGTYDRLPDAWLQLRALEDRLTTVTSAHGYLRVETPVLEHTELFTRKLGGERLAQTYQFEFRGRSLALRPEHTAGVVRLFVERMQADPLPVRVSYAGPVFRYESPQAGRSRQFTEFGAELIGASGLLADAETILVALECVHAAGVKHPRLVLGHIGVVLGFLGGLNLDQRAQDWLIWSMERIRRGDAGATEIPEHLVRDIGNGLGETVRTLDRDSVVDLLRQSGVNFESGARSADEIVQGLFDKSERRVDRGTLQVAVEFVSHLVATAGPPEASLGPLRSLVARYNLDQGPLDEIAAIVDIITTAVDTPPDIVIDLGLGRGLRYYTGMLFEIYPGDGNDLQLAGGGRYDDLASSLGARHAVPASGFSIGLERLQEASEEGDRPGEPPTVVVMPGDEPGQAFRAAEAFRRAGWTALVGVRERSPAAARRWATRKGYAALVEASGDTMNVTRLSDGELFAFKSAPSPEGLVQT